MCDIALRYKELREVNRLNQKEFAFKIGIKQSSLSSIEKGNTRPSVDTVISTSINFGVSTDWILLGNQSKLIDNKSKKLVTTFNQLSIKDQEEVQKIIDIKIQNT
jgi:transcriptional regulator with XRE-family HTH domain